MEFIHLLKRRFLNSSIEFMTEADVPGVLKLFLNHYIHNSKTSEHELSLSNTELHLERLIKVAAQKAVSFVIKEESNIVAVSLNLDVKDLLELFETTLNLAIFQSLGLLSGSIRNSLYKYSASRRGDYVFNIETIFDENRQLIANKAIYFCKGLSFCKFIGWKNMIFSSQNPILFLKMGGDIIEHFSDKDQRQLGPQEDSDIRLLQIGKISNKNRYLVGMDMEKLHIFHPKHIQRPNDCSLCREKIDKTTQGLHFPCL